MEEKKNLDSNTNNNIYLNGVPVTTRVTLMNNDRLKFGLNSMFLVIIPGTEERERPHKEA